MSGLVFTEQQFLSRFNLPRPTFADFAQSIQILDVTDRSGTFAVRQELDGFIARVATKDDRGARLTLFKEKLYAILVTDAEASLKQWFRSQGALPYPLEHYFTQPRDTVLVDGVFAGRKHASYGRVCKNINFDNYYNTRKLWTTDSEFVWGLLRVMMEEFKIRNSLVGPAFFDQICRYSGDSTEFWRAFMMGANRPSTFNPVTYRSILDEVFKGDTLFAPVMGWNSYQLAFYNSGFSRFIATDVIPRVVDNGRELDLAWQAWREDQVFDVAGKTVDLYLCPSEQLDARHGFVERYRDQVDAVLFSPPYFDLEIYDSPDQSVTNFPDYSAWLAGYWSETIQICREVMRPGGRLGFVISNYVNKDKQRVTISQDLRDRTAEYLTQVGHYRVQWSAMGGSRQAHKTREGNFEDLWVFEKR